MNTVRELKILALSGSLRAGSYNTALVHAARKVNPGGMAIELYEGLGDLPLYNADLDTDEPPAAVADLRDRITAADGLLIATPEHNYSIPAALKNALDWASTPLPRWALQGKPVAIAGASPTAMGTARAQLALRQVFLWTDCDVVVKPEVAVFRCHERFEDGVLTDEVSAALLRDLLLALERKIRNR
ncbi:NADPH-dependent FMN reductase [Saccharothrix sp. HUAS TT1]|uniref:NADPH-dependent FMN reductase n=1 Tax=unclassified Saccharothrix TaxID=2593673 RepID=UPI00345B51AB